ncbi:MAG: T9SS type A sorting domain-containing protein, partial [Chitinophagaceae bacterium]
GISLYPNPAKDIIYINTSPKQVSIIDHLGRTVKQLNNISEHQAINISQLPNGIYAIVIETTNGIVTKKIIKL